MKSLFSIFHFPLSVYKNVFFRIHYSDNRAIGRGRIALEGKARFFAATPKNQLANACANRVERDLRFSGRLQVGIQSLHKQ